MLTKTEIVELSKTRGFYLRKKFGQNFLIDKNLRDKIVRLIDLKPDDTVLEIGSGLGALTEGLATACRHVYAVERDKKLCEVSREILSDSKNVDIAHADILEFDIDSLPPGEMKLVGALPFYITTPIIERIIKKRDRFTSAFIVTQREVAGRLAAAPNTEDYSSLSLYIQFYAKVETLLEMRREAFFPVPKVDATLIKLDMRDVGAVQVKDEETLFRVIRQAFGQRRKTILSSLSHKDGLGLTKGDLKGVLEGLGVDTKARAETLDLETFARISDGIIDFLV